MPQLTTVSQALSLPVAGPARDRFVLFGDGSPVLGQQDLAGDFQFTAVLGATWAGARTVRARAEGSLFRVFATFPGGTVRSALLDPATGTATQQQSFQGSGPVFDLQLVDWEDTGEEYVKFALGQDAPIPTAAD